MVKVKMPRTRKRFETEMTLAFVDGMYAAMRHFRDEDAEYNALKEFVQNMEFVTPFYELCPYFAKREKKNGKQGKSTPTLRVTCFYLNIGFV